MIHERITFAESEESRLGHIARYRMAAGWLRLGDLIVDAACGNGYGAQILTERGGVEYVGIEKHLSVLEVRSGGMISFCEADLNTFRWSDVASIFEWMRPTPDVVIGFETLEHLDDPTAYVNWTATARLVFISVPLYPTVHENPHHRHDYTRAEVEALYGAAGMRVLAYFWQESERSGVWVFGR